MNIDRLARDLQALDIPLPDEVLDVQALRSAIVALVYEKPLATIEADVLNGTVTVKNAAKRIRETAAALLAHEKATEVARDLEPLLVKRERGALRGAGDQLIEAMRPAFTAAVTDASGFIARHGIDPPAETVLAHGAEGADAWLAHERARAIFDHVQRVCGQLDQVGYTAPTTVARYVTGIIDGSHLSLAAAAMSRGLPSLIAEGYHVVLNTTTEAEAVLANAAETDERRAGAKQAEADAAKQAWKAEQDRHHREAAEQAKAMRERIGITR